MRLRSMTLVALVLSIAALGCSTSQPTPAEVDAEFRTLLAAVDEQLPGAAAARLTESMNANRKYDIVTEVENGNRPPPFLGRRPVPRGA
ncbi:MAG TPA: hypothetical protein VK845_04960 [Gemmatimonadales bacterium]|nr:hypothetical protein [Gemmatimonadales bacterium]